MGVITIDTERCKKDGICASDCPMAIIHLNTPDGYPQIVEGMESACIACGHCVAICPRGALSHEKVPVDDCLKIRPEYEISDEQALQFLRSRRSIRRFRDKEVEKARIQRLIEVARYAPTGSNAQLLEWTVISGTEPIRAISGVAVEWMKVLSEKAPEKAAAFPYIPLVIGAWDAGYDVIARQAPALVVASAPDTSGNGTVDLSIALAYLELYAPRLGLGGCWAGILRFAMAYSEKVRAAVGLPAGHSQHYYPMLLGYPTARYFRMPERKPPVIHWQGE